MRVLRKSLFVTTLCLVVSVFMFADIGHAKSGRSGTKVKIKVETKMWPSGTTTPEPYAKGGAGHKQEDNNGVMRRDEFEGEVKIPVGPTSALGIVDQTAAVNADIRLLLFRSGTPFAECRLDFYKIRTKYGRVMAEYKVDVRMAYGALQRRMGVCDVNLTNSDAAGDAIIDSGIPNAQVNDVSTALLVDSTEENDNPGDRTMDDNFLQGTFYYDYDHYYDHDYDCDYDHDYDHNHDYDCD